MEGITIVIKGTNSVYVQRTEPDTANPHPLSVRERATIQLYNELQEIKKKLEEEVVPQPDKIEEYMKREFSDKMINDDMGWTGEFSLSNKNVLDLIIDLSKLNKDHKNKLPEEKDSQWVQLTKLLELDKDIDLTRKVQVILQKNLSEEHKEVVGRWLNSVLQKKLDGDIYRCGWCGNMLSSTGKVLMGEEKEKAIIKYNQGVVPMSSEGECCKMTM